MIVSCGQCNVRLKIDETKIKEGGSKLKCPKCGNVFLVERPAPAPVVEPPAPPAEAPAHPVPEKPVAGVQEPPAPPEPSWPPLKEPSAPPFEAPAPKQPEPSFTPPPTPPLAPEAPPMGTPRAPIAAPQPKGAPAGPKWTLDRSKIVVAHDGDSVLKLIESILTAEGYQVICESEGIATVVAIEREKPFLVILDVALPRIYGFEICDRLKNSPESSEIKVILLAAIYDKTRYKREPVSLYGADDYVEKHHIQDSIAKKVKRLAAEGQYPPGMNFPREEEVPEPAAEEQHLREVQGSEMRKEETTAAGAESPEQNPQPSFMSSVGSQQVEAARRFARIILSDIALYNQSVVEAGVRDGNFEEALAAELKEGRDLYNGRISREVTASGDYFTEEMTKFIEKKRQTMGLGM